MDWGWKDYANRYAAVGETLRKAMSMNPHMRVLVASGYFDFATPHFAADYSLDHLGLAPELRDNIAVTYYEAGHMMYAHRPSLEKLAGEAVRADARPAEGPFWWEARAACPPSSAPMTPAIPTARFASAIKRSCGPQT